MRQGDPIATVPETALPAGAADALPADVPAAPWTTRLQAVVWLHPATPAAAARLPAAFRGRPALPWTVGALVRYLETPVGPYSEVVACPAVIAALPLPVAVVAFMAVDSLGSVRGGRANWALPKTLGRFAWSRAPGAVGEGAAFAASAESVDGAIAWRVEALVRPRARALPVRLPLRARQPFPDGITRSIPIALRGRVHAGSADVDVGGTDLPAWLVPGRHSAVVLADGRATFGVAR